MEEFKFFVDGLMVTIRHEIASCEEKAYDSLPLNDAATLLFFDNMQQVSSFANEVSQSQSEMKLQSDSHTDLWIDSAHTQRGWQINPSTQTVNFSNKEQAPSTTGVPSREDTIPKRATIASNLSFARELESIV